MSEGGSPTHPKNPPDRARAGVRGVAVHGQHDDCGPRRDLEEAGYRRERRSTRAGALLSSGNGPAVPSARPWQRRVANA